MFFKSLGKSADRAKAGGAPKGHLTDNAAEADNNHKKDIGNQKRTAAVFGDAAGKHPDVAHAYHRTDTGQNKTEF